jgi:hypothetical protein
MTHTPSRIRALAPILALAATLLFAGLLAGPAQAALRHFDGTVLSKDAQSHTFRIETQTRNVRFLVNGRTEFERIPGGFSGLEAGLRVQVDAKRTDQGLLAVLVEKKR